ncbi:hypothetical protein ACHAXR_009469, partial [Thalassiosira sp. AJA248-18]
SNATQVRSNTTKSKSKEAASEPQGVEKKEDGEVAAINNDSTSLSSSARLPTVREGSPDNTTVTALTGENNSVGGGGENKEAEGGAKEGGITSPSPAPTETSLGAMSIEIGDENEQITMMAIESPIKKRKEEEPAFSTADDNASVRSTKSSRSTKSNRSIKSKKSGESTTPKATNVAEEQAATPPIADDEASVRSSKSTKSTKSTSSKRSMRSLKLKKSKSKKEETSTALVVREEKAEDDDEIPTTTPEESTSDKENEAAPPTPADVNADAAAAANKSKWVKKVSLSIGGYKTSFQFSDPMANLADAVNDALDVVGDSNLVQQAKDIDDSGAADGDGANKEDENERDYDENPTRLFMHLQKRAWGLALTQLQQHPTEASVWVYRKSKPEKAPNVPDADANPAALVVQHNALIVHDGNEMPKFRWKLLPLHAAIVLGAPTEIIQEIIRAYPHAATKTDERGSLPVHLAASRLDVDPEGEKVVLQLFGAYPDSIELQDRKGRTPPELAKLARARKDIEETRKMNTASASQASQVGEECTASQHDRDTGNGGGGDDDEDGSGGGEEDVDDDSSVKSSISGRFQQMLRKSKSTDTHDRRKKKNKKKLDKQPLLLPSASDDDVADDASVKSSLGPGFAFLKTSKGQEDRELNAQHVEEDEQTKEEKEEEKLVAAKKMMVSTEYLTPESAPQDTSSPRDIPLPASFSMGDDGLSVANSNCSSMTKDIMRFTGDESSVAGNSIRTERPPSSKVEESKSVTISDETQTQTYVEEATAETSSDESNESNSESPSESTNEGLRILLEKAVENAGRSGLDVTEFVTILQDEWVTDVEALRRLDGETLDDLLPLMLSRELQRLINHADSIDTKFLKEDRSILSRGRSPKKSSSKKKKKKKRSHLRAKKRGHFRNHRPVTPPEGPLQPITEEVDSPSSVNSDDHMSVVTEARTVCSGRSSKSAPSKLEGQQEEEDVNEEQPQDEGRTSPVEQEEYAEDDDDEIVQSASIEDLEIRKLHANLIADARKKFPTREALEDAISGRQAEVEAAVNSGFDVNKQTLKRAALADDEVRKLLPLRLILPTLTDLTEMIGVLQIHKNESIRSLDMENAHNIQLEIDELQEQIDKEEQYLLRKRMGETKCKTCGEMFPTEKKQSGILKTKEKHCESCRTGGDNASGSSSDSSGRGATVEVETVTSLQSS